MGAVHPHYPGLCTPARRPRISHTRMSPPLHPRSWTAFEPRTSGSNRRSSSMALNQGSSASSERLTRARSMQWILDNRVDANAASILLALPDHLQENIRRAGMLYNPLHDERNTSAMLRKRINDLMKGAFVEVPGSIRRLATSLVNSQQMPSGASSSSDEYGEVPSRNIVENSEEAILATATSKASSMALPVGVKLERVPPWKLLNTITNPGKRFMKRQREDGTDWPHGLPSQAVKTEDGEVQQRCHYLAVAPHHIIGEVAQNVPQLRDQFPLSPPMREMVLLIRGEGLRVGGRQTTVPIRICKSYERTWRRTRLTLWILFRTQVIESRW